MLYRRIVVQTALVFVGTCLLNASSVSLAADKAEEGFVSLFDGKTLDGWHLMNGAKFVVEDGVIKHNVGRGWLRSDKEFADFVVRLEFRFRKPRQDGGVFLRAQIEGKDWPDRKYEVQVENTRRMAMIFGAKHDLNVDLVHASPLLIDYVICHEHAHAFHQDHGKEWRSVLTAIMPDWEDRKNRLEAFLR